MPVLFTANFPAGSREANRLRRILWHFHACARLDEEACDILFILQEREPDGASPTHPRPCRHPITLPGPLGIELDEETGRFTVRSLPDRVLH